MMRQLATSEYPAYEDPNGLPIYLCQDIDSGRLAVLVDQGVFLPVHRETLDEFMAWHGMRRSG